MRSFLALAIVLCAFGGVYLLSGPPFFVPDRWDPSQGVWLGGLSSRLLGGGLLVIAWAGIVATRQAGRGERRAPTHGWQWRFFVLLVLALGLVSAAMLSGERGPNPDWRPPRAAAEALGATAAAVALAPQKDAARLD